MVLPMMLSVYGLYLQNHVYERVTKIIVIIIRYLSLKNKASILLAATTLLLSAIVEHKQLTSRTKMTFEVKALGRVQATQAATRIFVDKEGIQTSCSFFSFKKINLFIVIVRHFIMMKILLKPLAILSGYY